MKVICVDNRLYKDKILVGKVYEVTYDELRYKLKGVDGYFRKECFEIIEKTYEEKEREAFWDKVEEERCMM